MARSPPASSGVLARALRRPATTTMAPASLESQEPMPGNHHSEVWWPRVTPSTAPGRRWSSKRERFSRPVSPQPQVRCPALRPHCDQLSYRSVTNPRDHGQGAQIPRPRLCSPSPCLGSRMPREASAIRKEPNQGHGQEKKNLKRKKVLLLSGEQL